MNDPAETTKLRQEAERLRTKLAKSSAELQDLIYIISHDFRSPLRSIMSASMIIQEDYGASLSTEAKAELRRQSEAARKLNKMLEELLKLSRLNRHELELSPMDLGQVVREIASEKGLPDSAIEIEGDFLVKADPDLVRPAMSFLVDNSIKFAKPGEPVRIEFRHDGEGFLFRDHGLGVPSEKAERVFLPFEKLGRENSAGLGMGLAYFKRIMDLHGGGAAASGETDEGLQIRFTVSE